MFTGLGIGLNNRRSASGGASPATIWNTSTDTPSSDATYVITGSGLIATHASGAVDAMARGSKGKTTGTQSFIVTLNRSAGVYFVGLSNATEAVSNFVGGTANSVGIFSTDGNIYRSGGIIQSPAAVLGNASVVTVIQKNNKAYWQVGGVDVTGMNSTAETGGIDISGMGTLYPAVSANSTCAFTADFTLWP